MSTRTVNVRTVRTSAGPGLPMVGATLGFRPRPGGVGTYGYQVLSVDGRPVSGLLLGFPVLGDRHAAHTAELCRRLASFAHPLPDGLAAAAVWHGTVDLPGRPGTHAVLAPDPYAEGYLPLHEALTSGLLAAEPMRTRFELAYALAAAAGDLAGLGAVHGGLDASTLLLHVADRRVRITEVESATMASDAGHLPLAVGAAAGYLAPELYDGVGEHPEAATAAADRWSLAVALHEVLTGHHPYHFLPDLSPGVIGGYLRNRTWPEHHLAGSAAFAHRYAAALRLLPAEVHDLFARTFQQGWQDGTARPAAGVWVHTLSRWIGDPVIDELRVDRGYVLSGESVTVSWRTRFAHRILLDGRDAGPANGSVAVPIDRPRPVVLHAVGPFGVAEARTVRIEVLRVPQLGAVRVRFPLSLRSGAGEPGDATFRAPVPPPARPPSAIPLAERPALPDPVAARLPAAAPRFAGSAPPRFPSFRRPRNTDRFRIERHNP
ncbi:hypothetical protein ACQP2Y_01225 [Actinoplanes sp. CA-051413]|uniref:hypothetical protein n=1 Tax=Actinoplanes sp. CA-051413 TaxID=3239899 RepID=UPI003D9583B6